MTKTPVLSPSRERRAKRPRVTPQSRGEAGPQFLTKRLYRRGAARGLTVRFALPGLPEVARNVHNLCLGGLGFEADGAEGLIPGTMIEIVITHEDGRSWQAIGSVSHVTTIGGVALCGVSLSGVDALSGTPWFELVESYLYARGPRPEGK